MVNEQDLKQMDAEVKKVVVAAAEFATEPEPEQPNSIRISTPDEPTSTRS